MMAAFPRKVLSMQFPKLAPIKPIDLPDLKPIGTDSKKQSLQEWHAAGGGVPKQYKGREHVWHAKVKKFAEGGEVHMGAGGVMKGLIGAYNKADKAADAAIAAKKALPAAERDANLQKFLEPSKAPMRLYHGTTATEGGKGKEAIRNLKPSKEGALGSGVYLTPNSSRASGYAESPWDSKLDLDRHSPNVLPVHAQIRNPLIIEGTRRDPMIEALMKLGMDEDKASRMVERAYEQKGYIGKEVESRARAAGYDGLMQYRNGDLSEVVSYNPNTIKSAIGNQGTYDINSPDLSKARGGEVHMQKGGKSGALVSIAEAVAKASKKADEILDAQKAVSQKGALSKVRNESKAADEAMEAKRLALEAANPPIKASEAYGQHEGAYLKPIFYDRMKVDLSKRKFGGPGFSGIQLVDPNYANAAAGVTDKKMATRILNRNEALVPKGAKVIWTPSVGGLEQHKSNSTMFGEFAEIFANQRKNMSAEEIQKLSDKASSTVDNKGRLIFPNGIDLASRNFRQKVVTYPQRSLMADIFAGRNVGGEKGRTVPVEELLEKNLDPNMAGAGTLDLGNRLFRLEGNVMDRPDLHSDYRKILTGEDLNVNYLPVPIRNVYGDWEAQKKLDLLAQGKDRDVTQMDYTKNDPTVQLTDKLLTELQKRGYKEGGAVEKRFDGGGMAAAEFAGPGDDGGSLDKAKIMSKLLADMAKEQGSKEADSLSKPRAATDLLNRGVIANNPLSAIVDMVNMGLIPLDILGSKLTGRDIKVSSDKPFLGSEHVKDLMNKYNITSGEERPMMETALSFASPTGMIKGAQKTAELAKKAPEALSNVRGGLETLSADAQRPFRSATLTMEGVAPDLGQKGGDKFKDLVTKRMISGEGAPVGMERMGGRKTKKTTGQGLYENFAGQQETNPMVGVTIPRAGNLSTNKRLIADIGTAGRELGQEMVAAHKFTPLMFKNPKDATAMMIGGSERLTKDQIQNIAKALPGMIVTHSPKNNSMFVAPFEGDALDYKKASQTASEILGKGAKVQFGKADSNKDIMFRGDYDKMGARPSSAESTEMRNRLKKAEERIVRGPSVSQSGRQSQPSTLTSTVR
jgi:hypothetical protein